MQKSSNINSQYNKIKEPTSKGSEQEQEKNQDVWHLWWHFFQFAYYTLLHLFQLSMVMSIRVLSDRIIQPLFFILLFFCLLIVRVIVRVVFSAVFESSI